MARHGDYAKHNIIYQRHLHISERVVMCGVAARMASEEERLEDLPDSDRDSYDSDDDVLKYDTSSDEEET